MFPTVIIQSYFVLTLIIYLMFNTSNSILRFSNNKDILIAKDGLNIQSSRATYSVCESVVVIVPFQMVPLYSYIIVSQSIRWLLQYLLSSMLWITVFSNCKALARIRPNKVSKGPLMVWSILLEICNDNYVMTNCQPLIL